LDLVSTHNDPLAQRKPSVRQLRSTMDDDRSRLTAVLPFHANIMTTLHRNEYASAMTTTPMFGTCVRFVEIGTKRINILMLSDECTRS
jgi:hypothetical protein